ncbi:MAG: FAD-binding oxidoreductase, partial [Hyphomicrobiales bacterium]|nr:FAD-binding oxidoreductase [Hyphomicrobiales bacterium]
MAPEKTFARGHKNLDVAIIGGGAIGLAIAYSLHILDQNCRVAIIERDPSYALASTPRASGGVRRLFALPENIELSNHSIPVYEKFHQLMAVNGKEADIGFRKGGYLFIVPPKGVATLARNFERQKRHGVNVEWLHPDT